MRSAFQSRKRTLPPRRHRVPAATLAALIAGAAANAHADLTVRSTVNVTGGPRQAQETTPPRYPQQITTYYKGDKARVQSGDGTATLYDLASGKVYSLDNARKTYSVITLKQMAAPALGLRDAAS